jgi:hypothetical protein
MECLRTPAKPAIPAFGFSILVSRFSVETPSMY